MSKHHRRVFPAYMFGRKIEIEQKYGFLLAGLLVTDFPLMHKPSAADQQWIGAIVQDLYARLPGTTKKEVICWHGDPPPKHDRPSVEEIDRWARTRITIEVRIDKASNAGVLRCDPESMLGIAGDSTIDVPINEVMSWPGAGYFRVDDDGGAS